MTSTTMAQLSSTPTTSALIRLSIGTHSNVVNAYIGNTIEQQQRQQQQQQQQHKQEKSHKKFS